jgi:hypothetical protein
MKIKTKQNQRYRLKVNRDKTGRNQAFSVVGLLFTFEESF